MTDDQATAAEPDDLDLDRRLTGLFADPGLELTPQPGAAVSVLARVRRARRRRRTLQIAAPVLTAACLTGVVIGVQNGFGPDTGYLGPPAAPATPTVPADPSELPMTSEGVGALRLGMTVAQAEATGLLDPESADPDTENPDCVRYSGENGIIGIEVGRLGVAGIEVYPFIHTPQGLAIGDTYQDLSTTYPTSVPAAPDDRETYQVGAGGRLGGWYAFQLEIRQDGDPGPGPQTRIARLSLRNDDHSCD